jgi:hypothetical protein
VKRALDDTTERVDINDIRVILGLEWGPPDWFREGRRLGFFEAGWVTDRELLYARDLDNRISISDTLMLRAGIGY